MELFKKQNVIETIRQIQQIMEKKKEYLIDLDSAIGDGDLGLTMTKGFNAALETAVLCSDTDLGTVFKQIGFSIAKAAPSTMGTLMATAFIGAGKAMAGNEYLTADLIAICFRSMAESVSSRGKAKEGEKTLLDVLFPVARAVESCESNDICVRMDVAVDAAKTSLEMTKSLMSQHGKAAVFREKTVGLLDPGAVAACFVIESFAKACRIN